MCAGVKLFQPSTAVAALLLATMAYHGARDALRGAGGRAAAQVWHLLPVWLVEAACMQTCIETVTICVAW